MTLPDIVLPSRDNFTATTFNVARHQSTSQRWRNRSWNISIFFSDRAAIANHIHCRLCVVCAQTLTYRYFVNIIIKSLFYRWSRSAFCAKIIRNMPKSNFHAGVQPWWSNNKNLAMRTAIGLRASLNNDRWSSLDTKTQQYRQIFFSSDSDVERCTTMHSECSFIIQNATWNTEVPEIYTKNFASIDLVAKLEGGWFPYP